MKHRKKLPQLTFQPRDYQADAIARAYELANSRPDEQHLFIGPTGTGKSVIELTLLSRISDSILVTPKIEIINDMLVKAKVLCSSQQEIIDKGSDYGLFTPIRLRNLLAKGELPFEPSCVIWDEVHHIIADSWQDVDMYVNRVTGLGFTASPFRGTPKGTEEFRKRWATITPIVTLKESVKNNYVSFPKATIWPLVDDDLIDITNGEISVRKSGQLVCSQIDGIIDRCREEQYYRPRYKTWDRATMFCVPDTDTATELTKRMNDAGLPCVSVTQATNRQGRTRAFNQVKERTRALVQIDVVSEGVDLPLRRIIDGRSTMSPVKWLQMIGREMRPTEPDEDPAEYVCLCRNLERHCYLMEGMFPPDIIKKAQEAFKDEQGNPKFSKRSGSRAIGLEGLGKFVCTPVHMLSGVTCFAYNLVFVDQYKRTEYFVLLHPGETEPLRAVRESAKVGSVEYDPENGKYGQQYSWGKWRCINTLPDLKGCQSASPRALTPNQEAWWKKDAEKYGLNPHKEVTNRSFQVLPLLKDLG